MAQVWPTRPGSQRVVLMDDALAGVDCASRLVVLRALRRFAGWGAAALAVLHEADLAGVHADRVLVLREGRVAALGRPADVLTAGVLGEENPDPPHRER